MSTAERNRRKHFWVARVCRPDGTIWRVEGLRPEVHEAYLWAIGQPWARSGEMIPVSEERAA